MPRGAAAELEPRVDWLVFHLTSDCNLSCSYCYQKRRPERLAFEKAARCLETFSEDLRPGFSVGFYGGEPLLELDAIRAIVAFIRDRPELSGKRPRYLVSTNGVLLDGKTIDFFAANRFSVSLSHDGTAQEITRPSRANSRVLENLERMTKADGLELETNSVFTPATVGEMFGSARFLLEKGVRRCLLSYSVTAVWSGSDIGRMAEQLREIRVYLTTVYRRTRAVPVTNFAEPLRRCLFRCTAGWDRLALAADGKLWGCRVFADFFSDRPEHPEAASYCFGPIDDVALEPSLESERVRSRYVSLSQQAFTAGGRSCGRCSRLWECSTCPAAGAFATGTVGRLPDWICGMKLAWSREIRAFRKELGLV